MRHAEWAGGGFVVFGVTNTGEVVGQQVGVKTLEDVAAELRRIEPPAFPDVETINLKKGNAVVLLTAQASSSAGAVVRLILSNGAPKTATHRQRGKKRPATPEVGPEVTPEVTPEVRLLTSLSGEMTRQELQAALKLKDEEHFRKAYLLPALEKGLMQMTIPDKPRSSKQKYRITEKGRRFFAERAAYPE